MRMRIFYVLLISRENDKSVGVRLRRICLTTLHVQFLNRLASLSPSGLPAVRAKAVLRREGLLPPKGGQAVSACHSEADEIG